MRLVTIATVASLGLLACACQKKENTARRRRRRQHQRRC